MLKRRMLISALAGAIVLLAAQPSFAQSGSDGGSDDNGDDRGRGRGRGRGGDDAFDDRGGGSSSGHGSAEERAAAIGDSRADRNDSRLREDRESEIRGRLLGSSGGERGREQSVLGPPPSSEERGFFADLFRFLR